MMLRYETCALVLLVSYQKPSPLPPLPRQRTPGQEPLLAVTQKPGISMETLITDFLHFPYLYLGEFGLSLVLSICVSVVCLDLS